MLRHLILYLLIIQSISLYSQRRRNIEEPANPGNERYALELFRLQNFREALDEYILLIAQDSLNLTYNYHLGVCYLNTNINKSKALPYLQYASRQAGIETDVWYELGRAYHYAYRFEEAIEAYRNYMKLHTSRRDKFYIPPSRQIEMCRNAIELIQSPLNVTFFNLGPQINSPFPDFNPFVPGDESFIVYTSKRDVNTGRLIDFDGYYTSDVYMANRRDTLWSRSKNMGGLINSELIEETVGISSDGQTVFLYIDNFDGFNDIIWMQKKGRSFSKGTYISPAINSNNLETAATISPDNETIIFASERRDGFGGTDLYISRKLPSGEWMPAQNMGPVINTPYNEDLPSFGHDGKTLYFSSQGHKSMGGFDIFKTVWNKESNTWSRPVNLGYPINTPEDNMSISFSANGRFAYVAATRPEGYGDLDIYKVVFNDVAPPLAIIRGTILNSDSVNLFSASPLFSQQSEFSSHGESFPPYNQTSPDVTMSVYASATGNIFGKYKPNRRNGRYIIILPPGEYLLEVEGEGLQKHTETLSISHLYKHNVHIDKNIQLRRLE